MRSLVGDEKPKWSPGSVMGTLQISMGDQTAQKPRPPPPSRLGKGPTPGSFKPGQSGNLNGRPRAGLAAAEKVRELVDPAEWIAFELETARDTKMAHERRSAAWHALIDRGFIKPPAGLDLAVSQGSEPQRDLSKLTTEQLTTMLDTLRGLPAVDAESKDPRLQEPKVPEDV